MLFVSSQHLELHKILKVWHKHAAHKQHKQRSQGSMLLMAMGRGRRDLLSDALRAWKTWRKEDSMRRLMVWQMGVVFDSNAAVLRTRVALHQWRSVLRKVRYTRTLKG